MNKIFRHLFFLLLLLSAGSFNLAHAQALVDSRMSGSWYDPTHDGEGFVLQILQDDTAVVYWFTYDEDGAQRWFTGVGNVENDTAVFDTLTHHHRCSFWRMVRA